MANAGFFYRATGAPALVFAPFSSPLRHLSARKALRPLCFAPFAPFAPPTRLCASVFYTHHHKRKTLFYTRENYTKMTKMTQKAIQTIDSIGFYFCVTLLWVTKMTQKEVNHG